VTGNKKYLDLAKILSRWTGKGDDRGGEYNQDDKPVTELDEATGHAVRAGYMYSAMADVAALTGDTSLSGRSIACGRMWPEKRSISPAELALTAPGKGFGKDYELPNDTGYNETCAAIANVLWNWRMFLLHGDAKYIDVTGNATCLLQWDLFQVFTGGATHFSILIPWNQTDI